MKKKVGVDTTDSDSKPAKIRKYSGPAKGSSEAKARMQKVREAQWAKNGLVAKT